MLNPCSPNLKQVGLQEQWFKAANVAKILVPKKI